MKISNTAATHITDFFINSGTISNDDRASYIYCFEYAIDTIIFPLTILLSGLIFNRFISALLFAVIIIPLKMSAGGAHASTRIMCSILSYSLYFVTLFCYQLLGNIPLTLLNICYITAGQSWWRTSFSLRGCFRFWCDERPQTRRRFSSASTFGREVFLFSPRQPP